MRLPIPQDEQDSTATGNTQSSSADKLRPSSWKMRASAAGAVVLLAGLWTNYTVRHDNTPPADVFEPNARGQRPAPLPPGNATGRSTAPSGLTAPNATNPLTSNPPSSKQLAPQTPPKEFLVHVVGQVRSPGLYKLPADARVIDAISAAGGATPEGDTNEINLAAYVKDGGRIEVPAKSFARAPRIINSAPADAPVTATQPQASLAPQAAPPTGDTSGLGDAIADQAFSDTNSSRRSARPRSRSEWLQQPVDINRANAEELQLLPLIGPKLAASILEYRRVYGPFQNIEQLARIKNIGPGKIEKLRPYVIIR